MSLVRWKPAHEMPAFPSEILSMQREINRMFDSFFRSGPETEASLFQADWSPATDIAEHENAFVVKVELPGVRKEDVKITMHGDVLTVRGEKKKEQETKESNFHRVERSYGAFQRSFTLPATVHADRIAAEYKDGILVVTVPKSEEAKPRQIEVKVK